MRRSTRLRAQPAHQEDLHSLPWGCMGVGCHSQAQLRYARCDLPVHEAMPEDQSAHSCPPERGRSAQSACLHRLSCQQSGFQALSISPLWQSPHLSPGLCPPEQGCTGRGRMLRKRLRHKRTTFRAALTAQTCLEQASHIQTLHLRIPPRKGCLLRQCHSYSSPTKDQANRVKSRCSALSLHSSRQMRQPTAVCRAANCEAFGKHWSRVCRFCSSMCIQYCSMAEACLGTLDCSKYPVANGVAIRVTSKLRQNKSGRRSVPEDRHTRQ